MSDFESCLASLAEDSPFLINLNQTPPPSKSVVLSSSRPRSDSFRRRYTRSPLGEEVSPTTDNVPTRVRSTSRASSFTGSITIGQQSRYSMRPIISNSFQALPPILSGSSVHFRSNLDFNFQSFMLTESSPRSRRPSRVSECPALPPLPSLSQPLFPDSNASQKDKDLFQIPSLRHPNSPYVPFPSPMRRQIFRPLTPESSESLSECSNGARASELAESSEESLPGHKMSRGIKKVHRTMKHVAVAAKRMFTRKHVEAPSSAVPPHLTIDTLALTDNSLHPPTYPPSPGVASIDSSNTRSLALWLDTRCQETLEWDADSRHLMSLEDYERRGSWIMAGGKSFVCAGCSIHSRRPSTAVMGVDASVFEVDAMCTALDLDLQAHDSKETALSENLVDSKTIDDVE